MLPQYVRDHPRLYLALPRNSVKDKKTKAWANSNASKANPKTHASNNMSASNANDNKRKWDHVDATKGDASTSKAAALAYDQAPFPFPRPPADLQSGRVVKSSYLWDTNQTEHTYADGTVVTLPPQSETTHARSATNARPSSQLSIPRPVPVARSASARSTQQPNKKPRREDFDRPSASQAQDEAQLNTSSQMDLDTQDAPAENPLHMYVSEQLDNPDLDYESD